MKLNRCLLVLALLGLGCLVGCAPMDEAMKKDAAIVPPPPTDKPPFIFHRIMEGETFASIAKWYSGDEATGYQLAEVNPGLDPNKLKKGDIVKVPTSLAVVHMEQPDHSTQPQKPQKGLRKGPAKPAGVSSPPPPNGAPEIFGPK